MNNINSLLNNVYSKNKQDADKYLQSFFVPKNYLKYEIDKELKRNEKIAIRYLFTSKEEYGKRIETVLKKDPLCFEAIIAYENHFEDIFVYKKFNSYYDIAKNFGQFSKRQRINYINILDIYVEFLLDINNISKAIKVQRIIVKLKKDITTKEIDRLAYMYYVKEDYEEFYKLFCESEKWNVSQYIMLMITLLKNDENYKAKEVLLDMQKNIEVSKYIDHIWDIDDKDPEQAAFYQEIDRCYEQINSVPDFFTWCYENSRK